MTTGIPEVEREAGGTKIVLARFFVEGEPKSAGSKTATAIRRNGRFVMTGEGRARRPVIAMRDTCDNGDWKRECKLAGVLTYKGEPTNHALSLIVEFVMPRPKSHYRTGKYAGILRDDAPHWHTNAPDATKLLRCIEDALTGILWVDDSQIVQQRVEKRYGKTAGAIVEVSYVA